MSRALPSLSIRSDKYFPRQRIYARSFHWRRWPRYFLSDPKLGAGPRTCRLGLSPDRPAEVRLADLPPRRIFVHIWFYFFYSGKGVLTTRHPSVGFYAFPTIVLGTKFCLYSVGFVGLGHFGYESI